MNALATIPADATALSLPAVLKFEEWLDLGRNLYAQRQTADWMLADWMAEGFTRFGDQLELGLLESFSAEPRQLRNAAKVATTFPPHMRAVNVPFEVHAYIAQLPEPRRLETLQRASAEHWGAKKAREVVTVHRQQTAMFEDEDRETRLAVEIIRAWNRAPVESRRYFFELAQATEFGVINEDEAACA